MMKFDHMVNYNGVYYKAGEEVPIPEVEQTSLPIPEEAPEQKADEPAPRRRGRKPRME